LELLLVSPEATYGQQNNSCAPHNDPASRKRTSSSRLRPAHPSTGRRRPLVADANVGVWPNWRRCKDVERTTSMLTVLLFGEDPPCPDQTIELKRVTFADAPTASSKCWTINIGLLRDSLFHHCIAQIYLWVRHVTPWCNDITRA